MSRRILFAAVLATAVLSTIDSLVLAQDMTVVAAREIAGRVRDADGLPVPGATVVLANVATGFERLETSDGTGAYRFLDLGDGSYRVSVAVDGFAPSSATFA